MRISDWSSDVCSSDLSLPHGADLRVRFAHSAGQLREALRPQYSLPFPIAPEVPADEDGIGRARCLERSGVGAAERRCRSGADEPLHEDRKSVVWGKSGSVSVDLGGGRIIKKNKN